MKVTIDVKNPMELRTLGYKALNNALGADGTRLFIQEIFKGSGDFTKEKQERPRLTVAQALEKIRKVSPEEVDRALGNL